MQTVRLIVGATIAGIAVLAVLTWVAADIRQHDRNEVCRDIAALTTESNERAVVLRDFIDANVKARLAAAHLAQQEGQLSLAALQFSIAREYRELRERFTLYPSPRC
jgi:hypothetical protein